MQAIDEFAASDALSVHQGTAMFQPPEVVSQNGPETFSGSKADIWSASLTLYALSACSLIHSSQPSPLLASAIPPKSELSKILHMRRRNF